MSTSTTASADWPGRRLGLPEEGARSIARPGRRIAAIAIDWAFATVVSVAFFSPQGWLDINALATTLVFATEQIVLLLLLGGGIGHLLLGMRVVPMRGGYLGVWRPVVRTVLLCLAIPSLIWDRDQRGMHDRIAGTVLVRR